MSMTNPIPPDSQNKDYEVQNNLVQLYSKMTGVTNAYDNYLQDNSKIGELNDKMNDLNNMLFQSSTMTPFIQNLKSGNFDASYNQLIQTAREIADTRNKYDALLNELYNNEQIFNNNSANININLVSGILWTTLISSFIYILVKLLIK